MPRQKLDLKQRLFRTGLLLTVTPLIAMTIVSWHQIEKIPAVVTRTITVSVVRPAEPAREPAAAPEQPVIVALHTARSALKEYGELHFVRHRHTSWKATDEASHATIKVNLPAISLGDKANHRGRSRKPLVDLVADLTGAKCSVYQRMNPQGDMLRVATDIRDAENKRASGLYISATDPSLATVLAGKPFTGNQLIAGQPYLSACEPLANTDGTVYGMLCTSLPAIAAAETKAAALKPVTVAQPQAPLRPVQTFPNPGLKWLAATFLFLLAAAAFLWNRTAATFSRELAIIKRRPHPDAAPLAIEAARPLALPAPNVKLIASHLTTAETSSQRLLQTARDQEGRAKRALAAAAASGDQSQQLAAMHSSLQQLTSVNGKIAGLMKTVDEIAFQSRILSLNARIEAARAGDAGVSFAVIADQFGSLAQRCADAASSTTDLLKESSQSTREGKQKLDELTGTIRHITSSATDLLSTVNQVQGEAKKQIEGTTELAKALSAIRKTI